MQLLDPSARPVIAHRGDSAHSPENTLVSFERALALGADALEFDCRVTADGVPVVIHDATLDRTTDARGAVGRRTLAQLRTVDAGAQFVGADGSRPFAERGHRISTLDEVLAAFPSTELLIEIKEGTASEPVRRVLDRHGAAGRVAVASFVDAAMTPFAGSPYPTGAARGDVLRLLAACCVPTVIARMSRPRYAIASLPPTYNGVPLPLGRFATLLQPFGVPVHVWTVDTPPLAHRLWSAGAAGMVSNDPAAILLARDGPR